MHPEPLPPDRPLPRRPSLFLAGVLGWLVPGLGQVYVGRPGKAVLYLLAIVGTLALGWFLTWGEVTDPRNYPYDFAAQVWAGGPIAAALYLEPLLGPAGDPGRFFDVGRLAMQIGGLLNIVAISDALGEAAARRRFSDAIAARRAREVSDTSIAAEPGRLDPEEANGEAPPEPDAVSSAPGSPDPVSPDPVSPDPVPTDPIPTDPMSPDRGPPDAGSRDPLEPRGDLFDLDPGEVHP